MDRDRIKAGIRVKMGHTQGRALAICSGEPSTTGMVRSSSNGSGVVTVNILFDGFGHRSHQRGRLEDLAHVPPKL